MRIISTNSLEVLEEENLKLFLLVDIEIDSNHYRYTDCDIPLVYNNFSYEPFPFSIDNINSSMDQAVDSINLKITELNSALGIYIKDNDLNNNPRDLQKNNNVIIYYAVCSGDL